MDAAGTAREILSTMLEQLGFQAEITVIPCVTGEIVLNVSSKDESVIAGVKGEALNDWQVLVNRLLLVVVPGAPKVRVDAGHMRQRQEAEFREGLRKLAAEARACGYRRSTGPLNSWYRRLAHVEFEGDSEFVTRSEPGDKRFKKVTISLRQESEATVDRLGCEDELEYPES